MMSLIADIAFWVGIYSVIGTASGFSIIIVNRIRLHLKHEERYDPYHFMGRDEEGSISFWSLLAWPIVDILFCLYLAHTLPVILWYRIIRLIDVVENKIYKSEEESV